MDSCSASFNGEDAVTPSVNRSFMSEEQTTAVVQRYIDELAGERKLGRSSYFVPVVHSVRAAEFAREERRRGSWHGASISSQERKLGRSSYFVPVVHSVRAAEFPRVAGWSAVQK